LLAIVLTLAGLCVGSFLATAGLRSVDGFAGLWTGRSHCPACGAALAARDLVPILSWVLLRGRCRHCGSRIAASYPLTELTAALIGLVAAVAAPPAPALVIATLGWWLLGLALIDLRSFRLPDAMTLPLIVAGLLLSWKPPAGLAMPTPSDGLVAAAGGYAVLAGIAYGYRWLRGREGLGLGDAKLCAAAGTWLGTLAMPWLVLLAGLIGLILAFLLHRRLRPTQEIPFGPPLALAFWLLFLMSQSAGTS
jgi:leader peptidase (prepilin peptidase)/N-methyltransferase